MNVELLYEALVKIAERRYGVEITYNVVDRKDIGQEGNRNWAYIQEGAFVKRR